MSNHFEQPLTPRDVQRPPRLDQTLNLKPEEFAELKARLTPEARAAMDAIKPLPPKTPETIEKRFTRQVAHLKQTLLNDQLISQRQIDTDTGKLKNPAGRKRYGLKDEQINQQSDESLIRNISQSETDVLQTGIALAWLNYAQATSLKDLESKLELDQAAMAQELRRAWEASEAEKQATGGVTEKSKTILENTRSRAAALDRLNLLIKQATS